MHGRSGKTVRIRAVVVVSGLLAIVAAGRADDAREEAFDMVKITEGAALPAGRASHAGGTVGGRVVVAGGTRWNEERTVKTWLDETLVFAGGQWQPGPPLPHPVSEPMFASDGRSLIVAGGQRAADQFNDGVYRLSGDGDSLRWETLRPLPHKLTGGAGTLVGDTFYVACGATEDGKLTNRLWSLATTKPGAEWTERKPLPAEPRRYPALVAGSDGALYLLGGMQPPAESGGAMTVFDDLYRYDPASDEWTRLPNLATGGYCWGAAAVGQDRLLVTGRADGVIHDDVWLVNLKEGCVRNVGRTVIQSACAPLVRVDEQTWWLIGGEPDAKKTRTPRVSVIGAPKF